jgi:hypothetical protein
MVGGGGRVFKGNFAGLLWEVGRMMMELVVGSVWGKREEKNEFEASEGKGVCFWRKGRNDRKRQGKEGREVWRRTDENRWGGSRVCIKSCQKKRKEL